ncbi:hypothetical protein A3A21_03470 [Candidatus Jorgensenbacteria bacterium RIFCSPLOWO2_01_FULL_45_25b]|uniref:Response regulatory domain-containing protein n=1 Tax=Candidatus Jorgensenbacteria bacterium RIFCSPLOWO2_01_FULL_45_25b TaxID=1798471 RepID=A0A1F6BYS2_9BACT|nr:MAG: hypothetical protein A3A21_03470 [Candidatus Jorgensenbacteria bacterium RIFCSPLOWO2_01_FULL_45_25b]
METKTGARVLIVDDDVEFTRILADKLESEGFSALLAHDGNQCILTTEESNPDLILLDLKMPNMDGADTLRELGKKSATKDIPVIILTSYNQDEPVKLDAETARKLGAIGFLEKGADLGEVVRRAREALDML